MALTRKFLSAMGIDADKIDEIIEAHSETVNALKSERDDYKSKASEAEDLKVKLDEANKKIEESGSDAFKSKYDDLQKEYEDFKADVDAKAVLASKDKAYRQILKEVGVSEKRIDAVMKLTDLTEVELDGDKLKNVDKVKESIKTEWSDFITSKDSKGAETDNPPADDDGEGAPVSIPLIF